jgi:hypothetical protein
LNHVFRICRILQHSAGEPKQTWAIPPDKLVESRPIALSRLKRKAVFIVA